jgi:hypothetical protein
MGARDDVNHHRLKGPKSFYLLYAEHQLGDRVEGKKLIIERADGERITNWEVEI